jgi:hypothetical protein
VCDRPASKLGAGAVVRWREAGRHVNVATLVAQMAGMELVYYMQGAAKRDYNFKIKLLIRGLTGRLTK